MALKIMYLAKTYHKNFLYTKYLANSVAFFCTNIQNQLVEYS